MDYKPKKTLCSRCELRESRTGQRTCSECHALAERKRRKLQKKLLRKAASVLAAAGGLD